MADGLSKRPSEGEQDAPPAKRPASAVEAASGPARAADTLMRAWASRRWILEMADYPDPPADVAELYQTFLAMERHPAASEFGGTGGYKLGGIGVCGEPSLAAPLFRRFLVDAPACPPSAALQLFNVEAEIGVLMGSDLPARSDGDPHSQDDVWGAVEAVVPCIEACGRRMTEAIRKGAPGLGPLADCMASGGAVLGERLPRGAVAADGAELAACTSSLLVNGSEVCTGAAAKVPFGSPVAAVTWLANRLNERGLALQKGHLVITGALCSSKAFKIGDTVTASFSIGGTTRTVTTCIEP